MSRESRSAGLRAAATSKQGLDLRVQIPGDDESGLVPVGREKARHRVVGQMHAIGALVNEDRFDMSYRSNSFLTHVSRPERKLCQTF